MSGSAPGSGAAGRDATSSAPRRFWKNWCTPWNRQRPHARYFVTKPTTYMAIARRILPQRLLDYVLDKASDQ